MAITQKTKSLMMPVAMTVGILSGIIIPDEIKTAGVMVPYLIAAMLLIAYSKLEIRSMRVTKLHLYLFLIQVVGSLIVWKCISYFNPLLAQEAFICLFCPVATSAPVIVGMLGGNLSFIITYVLVLYIGMSVIAPLVLPIVAGGGEMSFWMSSLTIAREVMPMMLTPFFLVVILKWKSKKSIDFLQNNQSLAFYLWSITLMIVIGKAATYVVAQPASMIPAEIGLVGVSLIACLAQFGIGHLMGIHFDNTVAATQSLGQKNTAIGMWMIFAYMNPLLSAGLATYSVFQNTINSIQLYVAARRNKI